MAWCSTHKRPTYSTAHKAFLAKPENHEALIREVDNFDYGMRHCHWKAPI